MISSSTSEAPLTLDYNNNTKSLFRPKWTSDIVLSSITNPIVPQPVFAFRAIETDFRITHGDSVKGGVRNTFSGKTSIAPDAKTKVESFFLVANESPYWQAKMRLARQFWMSKGIGVVGLSAQINDEELQQHQGKCPATLELQTHFPIQSFRRVALFIQSGFKKTEHKLPQPVLKTGASITLVPNFKGWRIAAAMDSEWEKKQFTNFTLGLHANNYGSVELNALFRPISKQWMLSGMKTQNSLACGTQIEGNREQILSWKVGSTFDHPFAKQFANFDLVSKTVSMGVQSKKTPTCPFQGTIVSEMGMNSVARVGFGIQLGDY